jgi:hypothetical protein
MSPNLPNGKPKKSPGKIASVILTAVGFFNLLEPFLPRNKVTDSIVIGIVAGLGAAVDPRRKKQ